MQKTIAAREWRCNLLSRASSIFPSQNLHLKISCKRVKDSGWWRCHDERAYACIERGEGMVEGGRERDFCRKKWRRRAKKNQGLSYRLYLACVPASRLHYLSRPTLCSLGTEISTLLSVIGFCLWIQGLFFAKEKVRMAPDQHYVLAYQCKGMIDGEYGLCNGFIRVYFSLWGNNCLGMDSALARSL